MNDVTLLKWPLSCVVHILQDVILSENSCTAINVHFITIIGQKYLCVAV